MRSRKSPSQGNPAWTILCLALRLNVHFHALWPDGVFTCALNKTQAEFHPARQITDADVSDLVRKIRNRVLRFLHSKGRLSDIDGADSAAPDVS